jgi:hypothetical protein
VKLSLPDEGLVVANVTDSNQSWMYKQNELLYFWHDPFYSKVIVIISKNRSSHDANTRPYSASIFRLRGDASVQLFFRRAHEFFAVLSTSAYSKKTSSNDHRSSPSKKKRYAQTTDYERMSKKSEYSQVAKGTIATATSQSRLTTPIRLITRTEFDPGQVSTVNSTESVTNQRTHSETTVSSESPSKYFQPLNHYSHEDDDDRMTTSSAPLSMEYVVDLVRELKELRHEIASLKLERRSTPVRSISTSPLHIFNEHKRSLIDRPSSTSLAIQNEIDAETQTDFTLFYHRRKQIGRKDKNKIVHPLDTKFISINSTTDRSFSSSHSNPNGLETDGKLIGDEIFLAINLCRVHDRNYQ